VSCFLATRALCDRDLVHVEVDHHRNVHPIAQRQPRMPERQEDIGEDTPPAPLIMRRMVHAAAQIDAPATLNCYLQPEISKWGISLGQKGRRTLAASIVPATASSIGFSKRPWTVDAGMIAIGGTSHSCKCTRVLKTQCVDGAAQHRDTSATFDERCNDSRYSSVCPSRKCCRAHPRKTAPIASIGLKHRRHLHREPPGLDERPNARLS
jgi:hypothetical protein